MLRTLSALRPGVLNAFKTSKRRLGQQARIVRPLRRSLKALSASHSGRTSPSGDKSNYEVLKETCGVSDQPTLKHQIAHVVSAGIEKVNPELLTDVSIAETSKPLFGDYQYSGCMQLFAKLTDTHEFKSSRDLAVVISNMLERGDMFDKIEVAGPGFINFHISDTFISEQALKLAQNIDSSSKQTFGRHVIVDFSSPNIAKEMHVGHLRSTIIGDSLCRALEYRGFNVSRLNHVGDWGTQFGMLIAYMRENASSFTENISDLQMFYKNAKVKFDTDDDFKRRAQIVVTQLQAYDEETYNMWKQICQASRKEFEEVYAELDIQIEERGESFYNKLIPEVLQHLVDKEIAVTDEGALCIFSHDSEVPLICRKSDGGFNYASTDLAALYCRTQIEQADWIIYVTDVSQSQHFSAVFDAGRRAGWLDGRKVTVVDHVGFGLVTGEDGKRLRTRSGETVKLKDLLAEAKKQCFDQFQARGADSSEEILLESAGKLGIGAVKYADLRNNIATNYMFSFERMLDLKGNTAVYLQYTYARVHSILERAGLQTGQCSSELASPICSALQERALLLQLLRFEDAVDTTLAELMPSKMCEYTYTLCVLFNNFYSECKVFGVQEEQARLTMCVLTSNILAKCFSIIGMQPISRI